MSEGEAALSERRDYRGRTLLLALALLSIIFLAELFGGYLTGSLSLISDSFHVLSDEISLVLAFLALRIAQSREASHTMNYGYHRLEVLAAVIHGLLILVVGGVILVGVWNRIIEPVEVDAGPALVIAIIGLAANVGAALMLQSGGDHRHDLNIRGAYLHLLADAGASVAVIVGMLGIIFLGESLIDPVVAAIIGIIIIWGAIRFLAEGVSILLQSSPIDSRLAQELIEGVNGVKCVEDLKFWQVCSHLIVGTAHVVTQIDTIEETGPILREIERRLHHEFGVNHLTVQFETEGMAESHRHGLNSAHYD